MRRRIVIPASILSLTILMLTLIWPWTAPARAQQRLDSPTAPKQPNSRYVGLTKCAACHFDQYKDWKSSNHAKAFDILPLKYRSDTTCLKCHTTGVVSVEGVAMAGNTVAREQGVSCEACHGPGSGHAELALRFVNEPITEDGLRRLRERIHRLDMLQCVNCHISKAHKKHPPFDRDAAVGRPNQKQSARFFQSIHGGLSSNKSS